MNQIESYIKQQKDQGKKLFAWLIDPDKFPPEKLRESLEEARINKPGLVFLGGSLLVKDQIEAFIKLIREYLDVAVVLFPGSLNQVNEKADAILFLSLISGRNPDFLIGRHVEIAALLKQMSLEVLPTGYILVDCGSQTTASYISNTMPVPYRKNDIAVSTAIAGEMLGLKYLFLDGGSGADKSVSSEMINAVSRNTSLPLIVGGGIRSVADMQTVFDAGADIAVVGNILEKNLGLLPAFASLAKQYPKQ